MRHLVFLSLTVTPKQWENISDINIAKAEHQKTNSESMRALVQSVLEQTAADMQKQFQATTTAFQTHIQEIKSAKSQMEEKLPEVGQGGLLDCVLIGSRCNAVFIILPGIKLMTGFTSFSVLL